MLNLIDHGKVRGSFEQVIGLLGVPVSVTQTKPPKAVVNTIAGVRTAGMNDQAIVNAYGHNTIIFTLMKKDFATDPEKFDKITYNGKTYVMDAVHPVLLNGTLIGFKVYSKGVP